MRFHLPRFGPELLILLGGFVFVLLGRGRWASVEADRGYWYSAAESLSLGARPMHEIRLQWGPGSLWILNLVAHVFGMKVASFVVFQFVVGLMAIVGVQIFARRFLSERQRWLSAAILVPLIVWMVGPGTLLYPCAFSMSQALLLAIVCLLLCDFAERRGFAAGAAVAGALAALTFLTKQEFGVVAALGIGSITILSPRRSAGAKARSLVISAAAFLAVYFGSLLALARGQSFLPFVRSNLLWPWAPIPGPWQGLYRKVLGLDRPGDRLVEMANSLIDAAAFGGTLCFAVYFGVLKRRGRALFAAGLAVVWLLWCWRWSEGSHFLPMTLTLPAIVVAAALMLARVLSSPSRRDGARVLPDGAAPFFAVAAGAAVLLQREGYRGNIEAYYSGMGYVLAVPVFAWLIDRLISGPRNAGRRAWIPFFVVIFLLARFGLGRLRRLDAEWSAAVPFTTTRGTVYLSSGFAETFGSRARFIEEHSHPRDPVLVMPQTFALDFLLDRQNLAFFPWVSPGYLTTEGERSLIERCRRTPPALAIVFEGGFGVFHSGEFGNGFANRLVGWLTQNYPTSESMGQKGNLEWRYLPAASSSR